jgi:hypothetical protein
LGHFFLRRKKWPNFAGTLKNRSSTFINVSEKLFDKIFR